MRVIVCGGRRYRDYRAVFSALNALRPTEVIHGDYGTADLAADIWAVLNGFVAGENLHRFAPDWKAHGKSAGPLRNGQMADRQPKADVCLAFPGGIGTANMRETAGDRGITVMQWPNDFKDWQLEERRAVLVGAPWAVGPGMEEFRSEYIAASEEPDMFSEPRLSKLMGERL